MASTEDPQSKYTNCTTQSDCQGGGWLLHYDSSPAKPGEAGFHFEDERFIPGERFELRGQEYAHLPQDGLVPALAHHDRLSLFYLTSRHSS